MKHIWSSPYLEPYKDVSHHQAISHIITAFSTNRQSPGEVFFDGLHLEDAMNVLDLGCGFGFMTEYLARRVSPQACITGVDACSDNRTAFIDTINHTGRQSVFLDDAIEQSLSFKNNHFDVVLSSYALYFFVEIIPEITRVLTDNGTFIAISHQMNFIDDLIHIAGISHARQDIKEVFGSFCCENGRARLTPHFATVKGVCYRNEMRFKKEDISPLMAYVLHKLPFLLPETYRNEQIHHDIYNAVSAYLRRHNEVRIEKNDCCFRCTGPIKRNNQ